MKLSLAPRGARQSVLIFGPPKTGKTQLVSQLSATHNLIWFDLENGHATLFKLPPEQQERIELINLMDTRSFPIAIETCLKVIKGNKNAICEEHGKVDCAICKKAGAAFTVVELNSLGPDTIVVFDSLTQLTNSAIAHLTKEKPDDYKMQTDDWGNLAKLMEIFCSHVQQAKFNVVCISHETEVEQEDGKMKIVATAGSRNFSRNTAKYFGHVVYAQIGTGKHKFISSTTATPNIVVGSRTDIKTEKMDEPSLATIFASNNVQLGKSEQRSENSNEHDSRVGRENETTGSVGNTVHSNESDTNASGGSKSNANNNDGKTNGQIAAGKLGGLQALLAKQRETKSNP